MPDLYGDTTNPDLVLFLAGNQFMVVPDLIDAFRAEHPKYQRIFVETLPPGILASEIEQGADGSSDVATRAANALHS